MKPKLFTSWYRVVLFWWMILFFWYTSDNAVIEHAFKAVTGKPMYITGLNALPALWAVLAGWTMPLLLGTAIAITAGYALTLAAMFGLKRKHEIRAKPQPEWNGVTITMGELPKPFWLPGITQGVEIDGLPFTGKKLELVNQIFSYLHRHPKAFVGAGHDGTLVEHTLHVLQKLPESDEPLLAVAVAAHDAGKVLAWERKKGKWVMKGFHDDLSAMIVTQLPAYKDLTDDEQRILFTVLKYGHKWSQRPVESDPDIDARCEKIHAALSKADHSATATEKMRTLTRADIDEVIFNGFINALLSLQFQAFGLKRGTITAGWRVDRRLYLIEPTVRDEILGGMDEGLRAAYSSDFRSHGRMTEFTKDFMRVMDERGWLVKSIEGVAENHNGLWSILSSAGKESDAKRFDGIIILDAPDEFSGYLPKKTQYEITVARAIGGKAKPERVGDVTDKEREIGVKTGIPHEEKTEEQKREAPILAAIAGYGFGAVAKAKREIKIGVVPGTVTTPALSPAEKQTQKKPEKTKKQPIARKRSSGLELG